MKISSIILISSFLFHLGCQKFENYNENPNAPESVNPQFLLSNAIYEASNNQAYWGWHAGSFLSQHTSNLEFLPIDRYDLGNNESLWNDTYRILNDLNDVMNSSEGNEAYTAIAKILSAHQMALLSDLWTQVPIYEALEGRSQGNFTPKFDSQESIYNAENGILDLLRQGAATLSTTTASVQGDIMYKGNLNQWIKFANSLRIRYLVRISNKLDVGSEIQAIVSSGNLFSSNVDNAVVPYLSSSPNQWVIYTEREGRYIDVRMSKTAENILKELDDPRMEVYYKPSANSIEAGIPAYNGLPNGLSRESQLAYDLNDISLMGSVLRDIPDGIEAKFMTYDELEFCLAEAALSTTYTGSAITHYENAMLAAFDYYETVLPTDYLILPQVVLDGSNDLEKIMTQKWIASFMNGYEAWFDIRRTGYPSLPIPEDNLNGNTYPVRYRYPSTEQAVNGTNYAAAVGAIGGDTYNSKGWWEE